MDKPSRGQTRATKGGSLERVYEERLLELSEEVEVLKKMILEMDNNKELEAAENTKLKAENDQLKMKLEEALEKLLVATKENSKLKGRIEILLKENERFKADVKSTPAWLVPRKAKLLAAGDRITELPSSSSSSAASPPRKRVKIQTEEPPPQKPLPLPTPPNPQYTIIFSNILAHNRPNLIRCIMELGCKYLDPEEISTEVTHMVSPLDSKTLKMLLAIVNCKWVVAPEWLRDSAKEKRLLPEEGYGVKLNAKPFINKRFLISPLYNDKLSLLQKIILQGGGTLEKEVTKDCPIDYLIAPEEDSLYIPNSTQYNWLSFISFIKRDIDSKLSSKNFIFQR
eukprot:TRINITY_DN13361_c0_g1_i1.p1 TRINITY_DN13361_c0_g1~~TRINITY_DN13361_c0_g1_i1.p1  ORF type:complete len:340 (+),score=90.26 TRINITY_DN13361_c0_g1_i1:34-1053(+)